MNSSILDLPLKDIHLPTAISWWPLAIGWWLVLILLISLPFIYFLFKLKIKRSSLKKEALKSLKRIENQLKNNQEAHICLAELSVCLRKIILSSSPAANSTHYPGMIGKEWLIALDHKFHTTEFSQGVGQILLSAPYQRETEKVKVLALIQLCQKQAAYLC